MRGLGGMILLALAFWLVSLIGLPMAGWAADTDAWRTPPSWRLPILPSAGQSPLEAQMLGEKPFQAHSPLRQEFMLPGMPPGLALDGDGVTLRLPKNLEMRISVLYSGEPTPEVKARSDSSFLLKYSMDYRVLPNLQVGLSGYLYNPREESMAFPRPFGDKVMGLGPGIKYDLGRWSFLLKSQYETGSSRDREGLQNWFRVWYAF